MPFTPSYDVPLARQAYTLQGNGRIGCLMLHGFMGTPASTRPLAEYLQEQAITCHCPLLPGHGHYPDKLHKVSYRAWIAEVEEALQTLRGLCDEVFIVSHSMGTVLGAHLITTRGAIKGMVMLAPVYAAPDARLDWMWLIRYLMAWYYPHKSRKPSMQKLVRERVLDFDPMLDFDSPAVQASLPQVARVPTSGLAEMVAMIRYGRSLWPQLTLPVHIFQGGHDPAVKAELTQILYEQIPSQDKKLDLFPEAGHELMRPFDPRHETVWPTIAEFVRARAEDEFNNGLG
jgi:carboxylesterase